MMIHRFNPTVEVPPWGPLDDPTVHVSPHLPVSGIATSVNAGDLSPYAAALAALRLYDGELGSPPASDEDPDSPLLHCSSDEFRMYEFKVRRCTRSRSHDWTECPYAHAGEKARRRDPRAYRYSGAPCPEHRKGSCRRGDSCEYSHGVFECWLHPSRYRTQLCKDGSGCRRKVCFFAHDVGELRSPAAAGVESYDGSPMRKRSVEVPALMSEVVDSYDGSPMRNLKSLGLATSPPDSPPASPDTSALRRRAAAVSEVVASLRQLQLSKAKSAPSSWSTFASPRAAGVISGGLWSSPATPTGAGAGGWWDSGEETAERVESGRALRARLFEKLSRDNGVDRPAAGAPAPAPDVAWISELVK